MKLLLASIVTSAFALAILTVACSDNDSDYSPTATAFRATQRATSDAIWFATQTAIVVDWKDRRTATALAEQQREAGKAVARATSEARRTATAVIWNPTATARALTAGPSDTATAVIWQAERKLKLTAEASGSTATPFATRPLSLTPTPDDHLLFARDDWERCVWVTNDAYFAGLITWDQMVEQQDECDWAYDYARGITR